MRQRLLTRLGREADDALSEVMAQTLAAEERGVRDLERLATVLQEADLEVKRELGAENGGFVRVMTVHGAKGLEAPVVFLADTTSRPPPNRSTLLPTQDGSFLLVPKESEDCPASAEARALAKRRAGDEQLRLFYVALTRARDRLVVAGRLSAREKEPPEGSWYQRAAKAFERLGARALEEGGQTILRCGCDPAPFSAPVAAPPAASAPPAWLALPLEAEAVEGLKAPSALEPSGPRRAPSPLASSYGLGRFRRGELIHRLLQVLPDVPPLERPLAARRLMGKESALTEAQREEMIAAALGVLDDERFSAVFGPGSRAEVSLAGYAPSLPAGQGAAGRVDRMVIAPSGILVVDFKTNRPSPETASDADPAYLRQLAIYVALLRAIFPDRPVEAALVWTDGPKLMPIPEELLAGQLGRLAENN
jgi:ATP-dependent helicase/nuclease subunit A